MLNAVIRAVALLSLIAGIAMLLISLGAKFYGHVGGETAFATMAKLGVTGVVFAILLDRFAWWMWPEPTTQPGGFEVTPLSNHKPNLQARPISETE